MWEGRGAGEVQQWAEEPKTSSCCVKEPPPPDIITDILTRMGVSDATHQYFGTSASPRQLRHEEESVPEAANEAAVLEPPTTENAQSVEKELGESSDTVGSSPLLDGQLGANCEVGDRTYARARICAAFYPKFENERSDREVRTRMIEMVSGGHATLEVSLKHSGSLFMYAGQEGGAYAKNSFRNVYTAVGVFVLAQTFAKAWGTEATKKQSEFSNYLEKSQMCVSMELVTAVLGDHGQRPLQDYVVVTAVTELGNGKPKFYSTHEIIAFCQKWRLPTNQVWLFSTRKSVISFFEIYDDLREEGTTTSVCRALDEVADMSVPGTDDHVRVQGEILEGLVARIVSPESSKHMQEVLKGLSLPCTEVAVDKGSSLREICATNRLDEKRKIETLLQNVGTAMCPDDADWFGIDNVKGGICSQNDDNYLLDKFLLAQPTDLSTGNLQQVFRITREIIHSMRPKPCPASFKCFPNFHKFDSLSSDNLHFKMVIHVRNDSVFRSYQQKMRDNSRLWPLCRGFFVDVNLFKANNDKADELLEVNNTVFDNMDINSASYSYGLLDEDTNMMIKLKFLTYKIRTFLIRNGLAKLCNNGDSTSAYKTFYLREMRKWGTPVVKQRELVKMLDEWASYVKRKYGTEKLLDSAYLTEAEPFLEQYAKRSPQNQALVGSAGNLTEKNDPNKEIWKAD